MSSTWRRAKPRPTPYGRGLVEIELERRGQDFFLRVVDDGAGMEEARRCAGDPFFTTKPGRRIGLGLALLRQTAEELGGTFWFSSSRRKGRGWKRASPEPIRTDPPPR